MLLTPQFAPRHHGYMFFDRTLVLFVASSFAICGCLSVSLQTRPDFDPQSVSRVAILEFSGEEDDTGDLATMAGAVEEQLVGCGVDVIERQRVTSVMSERSEEFDYQELGRVLGVDLFIAGGGDVAASVREATFRGVRASDGRVVFSGSTSAGSSSRTTGVVIGKKICGVLGMTVP